MQPLRITQLDIQQIGPFGNLSLHFPEKPAGAKDKAEIHILTGENGTGKTTVLELLASSVSSGLTAIAKSKYRISDSHFLIHFDDETPWIREAEGGLLYTLKSFFNSTNNYLVQPFPIAFFAYSGYRRVHQVNISSLHEVNKHPFESALDFQSSINPQILVDWIAITITKEALEYSQGNKEKAERFRKALSRLEHSISTIISKPVRFFLETEPLNVSIEVDNERLNFNLLPDGLKSIISWIADLLMRMDRVKWVNDTPVFERNFILFLDEIEVHMHPAWQRKILPAVQGLFPNAQIFISTHSPFVVGSVDGAWIHKLVKPNGDSQLAAGYPMLSEDAKSVRYWLDEVFDIRTEYGPEATQQLDAFYILRDAVLKGANGVEQQSLLQSAQALAIQSEEMRQIIEMELRQVNRRTGLALQL